MIRDSEQHAETDKKKREMVECKNNAETQAVTAERQLTEWKYVTDAEKENVRKLLAELRTAMNNPNSTKDDIQGPTDKLQKAVMECGRTEYPGKPLRTTRAGLALSSSSSNRPSPRSQRPNPRSQRRN